MNITPIGQKKDPYTECSQCRQVANKPPTCDTDITRFEKLYKVQFDSQSVCLCRGCLVKLRNLIEQFA